MCYPFVLGNQRQDPNFTATTKIETFRFGGLTTADKKLQWGPSPRRYLVTAAKHLSEDAITADNTNYVAAGIVNKGSAGSGSTAIVNIATAANSTKATGGTALAALVPNSLTINSTTANLIIEAGDVLEATADVGGTIATDNYNIQLSYVDA